MNCLYLRLFRNISKITGAQRILTFVLHIKIIEEKTMSYTRTIRTTSEFRVLLYHRYTINDQDRLYNTAVAQP